MESDDAIKTENLLKEVRRHRGASCRGCGAPTEDLEILYSLALGFGSAPRCASCLAAVLDRTPAECRAYLDAYLESRPCYRAARARIRPPRMDIEGHIDIMSI